MAHVSGTLSSRLALGMTSLVLGTIGLLFFVFPVLGIPVSVFAMLFGLLALLVRYRTGGVGLRWALAGTAVSGLALAINISLAYAPAG